jgi:hypothetical protein
VIALCALLVLSRQSTPTQVKGLIDPGRCRIRIPIAGREYTLLVDTGNQGSHLRRDVKAQILRDDPAATLTLGSGSVPVKGLDTGDSTIYDEYPPIEGILGMDVLADLVIGIDYRNKNLVILPTGGGDWIGRDATAVPLLYEEDTTCPYVATQFGTSVLDTGATVSLMPKDATSSASIVKTRITRPLELFDASPGDVTLAIATKLEVADRTLFCAPVLLSDVADRGVVAPSLLADRIVIDLADRQLWRPAKTRSATTLCQALSLLFRERVFEDKGGLYLDASLAGLPKKEFAKIVSVNGRTAADLLALFERRDPKAPEIMRNMFNALRTGCKAVMQAGSNRFTMVLKAS